MAATPGKKRQEGFKTCREAVAWQAHGRQPFPPNHWIRTSSPAAPRRSRGLSGGQLASQAQARTTHQSIQHLPRARARASRANDTDPLVMFARGRIRLGRNRPSRTGSLIVVVGKQALPGGHIQFRQFACCVVPHTLHPPALPHGQEKGTWRPGRVAGGSPSPSPDRRRWRVPPDTHIIAFFCSLYTLVESGDHGIAVQLITAICLSNHRTPRTLCVSS